MEEVKIIPIDAWDSHLNLVITDDINACIQSQSELKKFNPEKYLIGEGEGCYDGMVIDFEEEEFWGVVMFLIYDKINDKLIVHEVSHAAFHILFKRNILLNEHTTEVYAYLEEYLFGQVQEFFHETKKKIEFNPQLELPLEWQVEEKK